MEDKKEPAFKVNDWVEFTFVGRPVRGRVVEDRGKIGVDGERLYRVIGTEQGVGSVTRTMELPAERLNLLLDSSAVMKIQADKPLIDCVFHVEVDRPNSQLATVTYFRKDYKDLYQRKPNEPVPNMTFPVFYVHLDTDPPTVDESYGWSCPDGITVAMLKADALVRALDQQTDTSTMTEE